VATSPALVSACEAALAATYCNWWTVANAPASALSRLPLDQTYSQHMARMQPHWCAPQGDGAVLVLHSSPYGDCFFCSISLLLTGHEGYQHTLRLHALIELILHPAECAPSPS
jgi:hypothetical protein